MCLYSTDRAFIQHKHDKYFLQTKGQKRADKEIFERHVKLQFVTYTISIGVKMASIKIGHALFRDNGP